MVVVAALLMVPVTAGGPGVGGGVAGITGAGIVWAADEAKPEAAKPESGGGIINGGTVFFGCATGLAVGALLTAFPPLANWALMAGALPSVVAVSVFSGVGCSFGLFGGVFVATVGWVFDKVGQAFSFVF